MLFTTDLCDITKYNRCYAEVHHFLLTVHYLLIITDVNHTEAHIKAQFSVKTGWNSKVKFILAISGISVSHTHTHLMNRKRQREAKCVPEVEGNFTQLPNFRREESGRSVRKEEVKSFR